MCFMVFHLFHETPLFSLQLAVKFAVCGGQFAVQFAVGSLHAFK